MAFIPCGHVWLSVLVGMSGCQSLWACLVVSACGHVWLSVLVGMSGCQCLWACLVVSACGHVWLSVLVGMSGCQCLWACLVVSARGIKRRKLGRLVKYFKYILLQHNLSAILKKIQSDPVNTIGHIRIKHNIANRSSLLIYKVTFSFSHLLNLILLLFAYAFVFCRQNNSCTVGVFRKQVFTSSTVNTQV